MARPAAAGSREARTRGALEIVTGILLGLVSVATAVGAYQAGVWGQQGSDLASASGQLRDRNLAIYLEGVIVQGDDNQRLFDAIALDAEATFYPERADALRIEQDVIVGAASPAFVAAWGPWRDCGFCNEKIPLLTAEYEAASYAEPQSYNIASTVADRASNKLLERSQTMTVVSVVFAIALLLLGVAGVSTRLRVSAITAGGGAVAFLVGVAVVIFGVF
jgi:hypothetical protein